MAAVGAAPFAGAVAPYNITATELQDAAFVQEALQVMIWLASVSPAIRNHASLRLPNSAQLGQAVPQQHQPDLLSDETWSERGFLVMPSIRGELRVVPKGTIIGAGKAALTQNEMNMVDILGTLWPHLINVIWQDNAQFPPKSSFSPQGICSSPVNKHKEPSMICPTQLLVEPTSFKLDHRSDTCIHSPVQPVASSKQVSKHVSFV